MSRRPCRRWPVLAVLLGVSWLAAATAAAAAPPPAPQAAAPAPPAPPLEPAPPATPPEPSPSQTAAPAPVPAAPSPADTSGSPVPATDPELAKKLPELRALVEEYRGLRFEHPVPSATISDEELGKRLAGGLHVGAEPAGDDTDALEISLRAFGLLPQDLDLAEYFPKLMGSQIAGFYDSHHKELTLVTGPKSLFGDAVDKRYGAVWATDMQEGLFIHELTHALQDQHFDLSRLGVGDALSDPDAARLALVEGDATLVMLATIAGLEPRQVPLVSGLLQKLLVDPRQLIAMGAGVPGTAELEAAPPWIRGTVLFSYLEGASFCADVLAHGGQRLLDHAFRTDPPRSTEQILHPEKWYGKRDDPVVIIWPDLQAQLPGRVKAAEGQLGELGIRILLQEGLHDPRRGAAAATGWGGDRFAVYRQAAPAPTGARKASRPASANRHGGKVAEGGRGAEGTLLAWITDWDTAEDAKKFAAAAGALGADWWVEHAGERRVVVLRLATSVATGDQQSRDRGVLTASERAAVTAALAGARAVPGANRAVDPAAIDPRHTIGAPGKITAARIETRRQKMLADQSAVESHLSEDRRTYSYPQLGVTFRLPATMTAWESRAPTTPAILLSLFAPEHAGSFIVGAFDLRQEGFSIEMLEPFFEEGLKSSLPGYAKQDGRTVEIGGEQSYELRFTAVPPGGSQLLGVSRFLMRGTRYVMMVMIVPTERWGDLEPSRKELFDSITVAPLPR